MVVYHSGGRGIWWISPTGGIVGCLPYDAARLDPTLGSPHELDLRIRRWGRWDVIERVPVGTWLSASYPSRTKEGA